MNSEIAEILGAFSGDGWIESSKNALYILGDSIEDKDYYDNYLSKLFHNQFKNIKVKSFPYWKVYGICCYKKEVIKKALSYGFQVGKKVYTVKIPKQILESKNNKIIISFLRGLFDADGCFWCDKSRVKTSCEWKRKYNYQPNLTIISCSKRLLNECKLLLNKLNIESKVIKKNKKCYKNNRNNNESYALNIRKKEEVEKWFKMVGTNNPRHQTRYAVWKKLGYLPPRTTIKDRINILNDRISSPAHNYLKLKRLILNHG